jgi:hypothetical protein
MTRLDFKVGMFVTDLGLFGPCNDLDLGHHLVKYTRVNSQCQT